MVLRAARIEWTLCKAGIPTKGAQTSLEAHYSPEFVNQSIMKNTKFLSKGQEPNFLQILDHPPSPGFEVWEPDSAGVPRRWGKPWKKKIPTSTTEHATLLVTKMNSEQILKLPALLTLRPVAMTQTPEERLSWGTAGT